MSDVPPISGMAGVPRVAPAPGPEHAGGATAVVPVDRVDISETARWLSTLELEGEVRMDKVIAIREAIAEGTYETEDKIEFTVQRLLEVLRAQR